MKNPKLKLITTAIIFGILAFAINFSVYATNENLEIVKKSEKEYMIYINGHLENDFSFAFSNDKSIEPQNLIYMNSANDSVKDNSNKIAYVNETNIDMFKNTTYMWLKDLSDELKVSALEIDLNDSISIEELNIVNNISKNIKIKLEQEEVVNEVNAEGTKITETVGVVKLENELQNVEYQLVKRPDTGADNDFFALAELIEKNDFTDIYTQLIASKEFLKLYNEQYATLSTENWKKTENGTIYQPNEAETGDQYILWVKDEEIKDVHFLTSYREYDEEFVKEEITTKLPYTYDSNALYIALILVLGLIVVVSTRIIILRRNDA